MSGRERRIDRDLRALGEAHYAGRLGRQDYRARRRALLAGELHRRNDSDRTAPTQPDVARKAQPARTVVKARVRERPRWQAALTVAPQLILPIAFVVLVLTLLVLWL